MKRFFARLRRSEEIPRVRTNARGAAAFQLSDDGRRLQFISVVKNIRKVTQAHIPLGRRGENGPVVVFLFGSVSRGLTVNRGVVTGTITSIDLIDPLARRSLSVLVREMRNGNAYVTSRIDNTLTDRRSSMPCLLSSCRKKVIQAPFLLDWRL